MSRVWAVILFTVRDGVRLKVWYPFLVAALLGVLILLGGFGIFLAPNAYANNIISSFFMFWSWGTILTALCLGASSVPAERRSSTLFTLPIARWELVLGKLAGTWLLVATIQIAGYLICLALAAHVNLEVPAYSLLGLATALTVSLVWLCVSVPLGVKMSSMAAGTMTILVLLVTSIGAFVAAGPSVERREALEQSSRALSYAFFDRPVLITDYTALAGSVMLGAIVFSGLTLAFRRTEP